MPVVSISFTSSDLCNSENLVELQAIPPGMYLMLQPAPSIYDPLTSITTSYLLFVAIKGVI